jgi:hypothetical protein
MVRPRPTRHTHHEGAREDLPPGQPASREVIKPDWAELEQQTGEYDEAPGAGDEDAAVEREEIPPKTPTIDRHR